MVLLLAGWKNEADPAFDQTRRWPRCSGILETRRSREQEQFSFAIE
jgi:hypothetical protein